MPELPPLSVYLDDGVVPRSSRDDNHNQLGSELANYLVVRRGDVVFNKLRTWQGGLGVSDYSGIVSPAYFVCRPVQDIHPRFLHYLLRSEPYRQELARVSKWMPPSQFDIGWDELRVLPILVASLAEQVKIADFLDAETAQIDVLLRKKRQMLKLLYERYQSELSFSFSRLNAPVVSLGRFVRDITQGVSPQADSAPAEDNEWGLLKLSAVKSGRFIPSENKRLPVGFSFDPKLVPLPGDLLVTRSNTPDYVGDACAVVNEPGQVVLCDLIYRLRLDSRLLPEFAAGALLRPEARWHLSGSARGTSQSMVKLRGEDVKATPIPVVDLEVQRRVLRELDDRRRDCDQMSGIVDRQACLIVEWRQALITAAVTGQLDVPGVSAA